MTVVNINNSLAEVLHRHIESQTNLLSGKNFCACKICQGDAVVFDDVDLGKQCSDVEHALLGVAITYYKCTSCGFIFTRFFDNFSNEDWVSIIYNREYYQSIDPDYNTERPRNNANVVDALLRPKRNIVVGLDYGGGNGQTALNLRSAGYRYDTYDPFGESEVNEENIGKYDFCSAFEVAEHTTDPVGMMADIVRLCSKEKLAILVGTQISDKIVTPETRLNWRYAAPRNGHISLYSRRSMHVLARRFGLDYIGFSNQTHLFTRRMSLFSAYSFLMVGKIRGRLFN
jgi:hypothetical protein